MSRKSIFGDKTLYLAPAWRDAAIVCRIRRRQRLLWTAEAHRERSADNGPLSRASDAGRVFKDQAAAEYMVIRPL